MSKYSFLKMGGFVGTIGAGAALVAAAAGGTGAWFTDSQNGNLSASTGSIQITASDTTVSFAGLMPGENRSKTIDYTVNTSSGQGDVWLTFDTSSVKYLQFTGNKNNPTFTDGGMGRYGHFAVANNGSTLFSSYNLANESDGVSGCANANGHGSGPMATSVSDTPPYCGVPGAIKIASGLANGQGGHLKLTFGVTGRWTGQNAPAVDVPFKVVVTQAGHKPGDSNF